MAPSLPTTFINVSCYCVVELRSLKFQLLGCHASSPTTHTHSTLARLVPAAYFISFFMASKVRLLGRSRARPSALSQKSWDSTPKARLTPNMTV